MKRERYKLQTTHRTVFWSGVVPFVIIAILASCRSIQPPPQSYARDSALSSSQHRKWMLPNERKFCRLCSIEGTIDVESIELSASGVLKLLLAERDSLQVTVYGPLGILAGRVFCTRRDLLVFNALSMTSYYTTLDSGTLKSVFPLPMRAEEIFALLRCELPYPDSLYFLQHQDPTKGTAIFVYAKSADYIDLAEVDTSGLLRAYQRKSPTNELLFALVYRDYRHWQTMLYPSLIRLSVPSQALELSFTTEELRENVTSTPFRFRVPNGVPQTVIR